MHIIGGQFKNTPLIAPEGLLTRPTSSRIRETLFNICQNEIENARFLDLFAGSGAMGIEALSRGASHVTFIDQSLQAIQTIRKNLSRLYSSPDDFSQILKGDALSLFFRLQSQFDMIYVDPPYKLFENTPILETLQDAPPLRKGGSLFIEEVTPSSPSSYFILKSQRKIGKAFLSHFIKKD